MITMLARQTTRTVPQATSRSSGVHCRLFCACRPVTQVPPASLHCFVRAPSHSWASGVCLPSHRCCAVADDVEGVPEVTLKPLASQDELNGEKQWIAGMVTLWLDEEWTPLDVHKDLGAAAADAYGKLRTSGENDMGYVLLGLSNELMAFNFRETFTGPFEVANKVVEMLMMRDGIDVCCTNPEDCDRMDRFNASLSSSD